MQNQDVMLVKMKLITIRDILRFMLSSFNQAPLHFGHGTNNAYDEAVYLLLKTLYLPLDELNIFLDARLLPSEIDRLFEVIQKRVVERLPAPYITNQAIIQGYSFYVDRRVIIPRSYIAEVICNETLQVEHIELIHNVLDLCTGNGSLAVIAAEHFYASEVVASDISLDALAVAWQNINDYSLDNRIKMVHSDLFDNIINTRFDLILSNPPYIDEYLMNNLPAEYLHEPQISLSGGTDGLLIVDRILKNAAEYLTDFGILVVEMGDNQSELIEKYPGLNFNFLATTNNNGIVFTLNKVDLINYFN